MAGWKRFVVSGAACSSILLMSSCGTADPSTTAPEPFAVSIMTTAFSGSPAGPDNKIRRMLEEYTDTRLDITWVPNSSYLDKLNITLASGRLPMVLKVENTRLPSVANAIRAGVFWELGPYLADYPNLAKADPGIMKNLAVDGKIYGIYRARAEGRVGISYRKDWLDRLGLQVPASIDQFYEVLNAFTYGDPDGNGKQDTFGLAVSQYALPWNVMQLWFGAPNKWGAGPAGGLVPDFMTEEYREALRFFRKLYEEKLVNQDFPIYDSARWNDMFVNGKAGVMLDVADTAGRLESALSKNDPIAKVDVAGFVSGPMDIRVLPTSGYSGVYMVSRTSVGTEEELRKVLRFLDQLNDPEIQRLLSYGIENEHYEVKDGRLHVYDDSVVPEGSKLNDLGQLLMMIPDSTAGLFKPATHLREKVQHVIEGNEPYLVRNPAEAAESETYAVKGAMLDRMMEEARIQYIVGKIDDRGWEEAVRNWTANGGERIIREINESGG